MAGAVIVGLTEDGMAIGPQQSQPDLAVGPNFERFDGLEQPPLLNPAGRQRTQFFPAGPRPGQSGETPDVYTPGPISGVVGTVGGQPLPATAGQYWPTVERTTQLVNTPGVQFRFGVGQHGPSALGAAQTVQLSEITNQPPVPGDITGIIAGLG